MRGEGEGRGRGSHKERYERAMDSPVWKGGTGKGTRTFRKPLGGIRRDESNPCPSSVRVDPCGRKRTTLKFRLKFTGYVMGLFRGCPTLECWDAPINCHLAPDGQTRLPYARVRFVHLFGRGVGSENAPLDTFPRPSGDSAHLLSA